MIEGDSDDQPLPSVPRRKRRRKIKSSPLKTPANNDANLNDENVGWRHHSTTAASSSSTCNALDAELENQVNKLIGESDHQRKEQHTTTKKQSCADIDVNTKLPNDMSSSLPMLLFIRESGVSSRLGRYRKRIPFVANVDSADANGNSSSWMNLLLHRPAHSRTKRRDNQHSNGETLWNKETSNNVGGHSNITRRLRVPVQNWHALNEDNDCYKDTNTKDLSTCRRKLWRPFTQQTIPFSKLKTPHSVAILAINQWGGYSIGVAGAGSYAHGREEPTLRPSLSIRFYGIPSPARSLSSAQSSSTTPVISPLVHCVPLLLKNQYNSSGSEESPIQISDTPIQILLCSNGAFGVGYVIDLRSITPLRSDLFSRSGVLQDDVMGTLVIFETPRDGNTTTTSLHCSNIRIGGWKSFTMRNALWPTMYVPVKLGANQSHDRSSSLLFDTTVSSAHILFNDEDDGFRITWINAFTNKEVDYATAAKCIPLSSRKIEAVRRDIITEVDVHETWEECLSDSSTGLIHKSKDDDDGPPHPMEVDLQLNVAYEAYLHVDALLIDIITRRQQSSSFKRSPYDSDTVRFIPNFYYNLISVSEEGLDATLVIVFSNKEKMIMQSTQSSSNKKKLPAALGVVIKFNLFNQSYDELKWVQHPSCDDDASMKQWCNTLALNWRMKECGVGVFCLEQSTMKNDTWVGATHERNVDEDLEDDYNVDLWSNYYRQKEEVKAAKSRQTVAPPKDISMSTLYPHCDVITNRAVYDAIPVKKIASRKSPIELIYG